MPTRKTFETRRSHTIRDAVQPAYRELLTFFRGEYVPGTRTTLAAYDLPDGQAYYRARIRQFTTLDQDRRPFMHSAKRRLPASRANA